MSLKSFHIIFIIASILLLAAYGAWSIGKYQQTQQFSHMIAGIGSFLLAVILVIYEINFAKKKYE